MSHFTYTSIIRGGPVFWLPRSPYLNAMGMHQSKYLYYAIQVGDDLIKTRLLREALETNLHD